jgi:peptidoglycan/xylan/chitin deacetylase (PgdA/CDA1 family)
MYHGSTDEGAQEMASQLRYLARNFKIVSLETMVDRLAMNAGYPSQEIVLSFDDGLRNNLTVVYPILKQLNIPATFFVCPGLIGSGKWLWNHEVRCRLQTLSDPALSELTKALLAPKQSVEEIIRWMKTLYPSERRDAEEMIQQGTHHFRPTTSQYTAFDIMDWDELLSLDPKLVTIGSHTVNHPILTNLSDDEVEYEVRESRQELERRLQRPVNLFCYPNGSYDSRTYQAVRSTYRAAVTTESGVVGGRKDFDLHRLPRIPSAETAALTAWRLHRPEA